ncbi:MAG: hypothetical protein C3F02_02340 [Parcubacteria group bacterium]|nr:MAG: hypothetical protein C3F02_02340 [Parcubacteria group bacterium]
MNKLVRVNGIYKLPLTVKADWSGYLAFSIIFVPISLLWIYIAFDNPTQNYWLPNLIIILVYGFVLIWLLSFKIILTADGIFYKTLFSKGLNIYFAEIKKVEMAIGMSATGGEKTDRRLNGFYRLNIFTNNARQLRTINLSPFGKRDWAILIDTIMTANPATELDVFSKNLYKNDFKPITHEILKKFWQFALWSFFICLILSLLRGFMT